MSKKKHKNNKNKNSSSLKQTDSDQFKQWLDEHQEVPDKDKMQSDGDSYHPFSKLEKTNNFSKEKADNVLNNTSSYEDALNESNANSEEDDTHLFFQWLGEDVEIQDKDSSPKKENDEYKKPFSKKGKSLKKSIKPKHQHYNKFYVEDADLLDKWLNSNGILDKDASIKEDEKYKYPPHILEAVRIDSSIDLHGLTVTNALFRLQMFIEECFQRNDKVVKIIHGKGLHSHGGPKLKSAVKRWLISEGKSYISLYKTAPPKHGGTGSVIVWLR